ncbi:pyrimidine-nucleoside phosphorylase, partial [Geobacillus stearothermophilus]|nr:pyrimidine-nucleoside phosphorylase [Geobacillus stearothermophilus]
LGAGRAKNEGVIDLAVGIVLHKKIGDRVQKGEALATIHSNRPDVLDVKEKIEAAIRLSPQPVARPPLIYETIV